MRNPGLEELQFQYPFRLYQQQILEKIDVVNHQDSRFHIVAPPGSGKSVVGLELIRRIGKPAVIFAPNTTIVHQWQEQAALFLSPQHKKHLLDIVSSNPQKLKLINVFTYQLISTPDQNNQFLEKAGLKLWQDTLIESRLAATPEEATKRIRLLKTKNPIEYAAEIARFKYQAKQHFLLTNDTSVDTILHSNARILISNLVKQGIQTIVLDEVHHLLDYWAITIKALAQKIPDVHLIGLTATPPRSASNKEKENYLLLMGDIDYEIPTPAVVKEGNLAPYQDLLYICEPTAKEKDFIANIQLHFEEFIASLSKEPLFVQFLKQTISGAIANGSWRDFFKRNPALAIALVKTAFLNKLNLPREVIVLPEMKKDITLDDWAVLLKTYSLEYLKLNNNPEYVQMLDKIKAILRMFGYVLTEGGIKDYRSPTDLILAYSEAKTEAAVAILQKEMTVMGDRLRAVVMTDFEKMNITAQKRVQNVLDKEAGGAVGVFKAIVSDSQTTKLEPVLITGKNLLVDADELPIILKAFNTWRDIQKYDFDLHIENTEYGNIKQVIGNGKDWKTSIYVRMVTEVFEQGIIKCIVGTRGLIGEGWNSLRLNTLIDMTCVTSSTSTNQIMGRALRLDPQWPEKLANIWYITCLDTSFAKGDQDLNRIIRKHRHYYGINNEGKIVKGIAHLDATLTFTLLTKGFKQIAAPLLNQEMFKRCSQREVVRQRWQIGKPYRNIELSGLSLNFNQIKIKTAYAVTDTARSISLAAGESLFGFSLWYLQNAYQILHTSYLQALTPQLQQAGLVLFVLALQVHAGYQFKRLYTKLMTRIPVDAYVKDIATAVVGALGESGVIDKKINPTEISISRGDKGRLNITLQNIDSKSSLIINNALSDVFSPVTDQRYLIERTLNRLPLGLLSPLWWLCYIVLRLVGQVKPTYHPVPDILAINKQRARCFAAYWRRFVGGGKLVYTRSVKGNQKLLYLRQTNNHEFEKMTYETWQ